MLRTIHRSILCAPLVLAACGGPELEPGVEPARTAGCGGFGVMCVISGVTGAPGAEGDGGPASEARHYWPEDVHFTEDGIFVVDFENNCVRQIDRDGIIDRFFGSSLMGDDAEGTADGVSLHHPASLAPGPDGRWYLAAWNNAKIKVLDPATGRVTTPVGTTAGFGGDFGLASRAQLDRPSSVVFGPDGTMYVADQGNQRIRKIDPSGVITTVAGDGTAGHRDGQAFQAQFHLATADMASPGGRLAITPDGKTLYVADTMNHQVRRIDLPSGEVMTIAGTGEPGYSGDGDVAQQATLRLPSDVALGPDGEVYVADRGNHAIRRIDPWGTISTVAGTGEEGASPSGTPAIDARLSHPGGIFVTPRGVLYVADTNNHRIVRVIPEL